MKILYVSDCFVNMTVFESQVHTLCNYHAAKHAVHLLAYCGGRELFKCGKADAKYTLTKAFRPPKTFIPAVNNLAAALVPGKTRLLANADIIHCRGHVGTALTLNMIAKTGIKKPVIADIRGELVAELKFSKSRQANYFAQQAQNLEKFVFQQADFFFFVSDNMKQHYISMYGIPADKTAVFPTIVNERYFYKSPELRQAIRTELGIQNRYVYVYCGGTDYWQNIDKMVARFDEASKQNPELFFLMIVKDRSRVDSMLASMGINNSNIRVISLPYPEVGKYLNAADAGLLIRENNIVNQVASPTKLNEYLACGLDVIEKIEDIGGRGVKPNQRFIRLNDVIAEQEEIYCRLIGSAKNAGS